MFYVYLLRSGKDGRLYIGQTSDLERRLREHNSGVGRSTKSRTPFSLMYYEAYKSFDDAKIREEKLKQFKNSYTELKKRLKYSFIT